MSDPDSLKKLEKVQSYFRQNYVRNELLKLRNVYEEIFNEMEGPETDVKVVWPDDTSICLPKFVSKKEPKSGNNNQVVKFVAAENNVTNEATKTVQQPSPAGESKSNNVVKSEDTMFDVDLNIDQMNFLSSENLRTLSKAELLSVRENVSLEMLWIQQAIQSRVQVNNELINPFNTIATLAGIA